MLKKAVLSVVGMFLMAGAMATPSKADVSFCLSTPTTINLAALTSNEVGVVIVPTTATGTVITTGTTIQADNYYKASPIPAGPYWTSALPQSTTLLASCYTVSISAKNTPADGSVGTWSCGATTATQSLGLLSITGSVTPPGNQQAVPVANLILTGMTSSLNTNAGNLNCPPPGQ
jgi:hypothetical protein